MFPLPKPYVFGESEWEERDPGNEWKIDAENYMEKFFRKIWLHSNFWKRKWTLGKWILGTKILMN